ncbi:glycosyltransferase family 2 protein, partial [Patescibacteria group bacterium]|nr:glycosyltransferase family 2 protein [Patescibacteria group bacterium]
MPDRIFFNYIITIYNKESLIEKVLEAVIRCCRENSRIYTVLDGCVDNSEKIINKIIQKNKKISITKVFTNDVHELLSINAGLKQAPQDGVGYNIVLQDDVILEDYDLESKIINLYKKRGDKLGYVSFRMGANLKNNILVSREAVPYSDYVEN